MYVKHLLCAVVLAGTWCAMPQDASAYAKQVFDLRTGEVNADWQGVGDISMQRRGDGIFLTSGAGTGYFLTDTQTTFHPDVAQIVFSAPSVTKVLFVWSFPENPHSKTSFLETTASPVAGGSTLLLNQSPDWKTGTKRIGLLLPPNSTLLLQRIEFYQWNFSEKLSGFFRSIVTLDDMRPYTINFVWGPYIAWDPLSAEEVYQHLPPLATSATRLINVTIGVVILLLLVGQTKFGRMVRRHVTGRRVFVLICGLWLLVDLFMGIQFLSWVRHDQKTYISGVEGIREFRDRKNFYDFAEFVKPLLKDRSRYIFVAESPWPYLGNIRYLTYPSIPAFNIVEDDTWVIYNRPDFQVSDAGQLIVEGDAITQPGQLLGVFDDGSFVFRSLFLDPPRPDDE